jgi:hypothetical protein
MGIMVSLLCQVTFFCCICIVLGFTLGEECIFFWNLKNKIKSLCAFRDCVEPRSNFPLCLACFESMVLGVCGENKRCGGEVCNIGLFAHGDVHVHQLMKDH